MSLEITSIPQGVRAVEIDGHGMAELLELMLRSEPRDITTLAAVRYMFHKRLWDNQAPLAKDVLNRSYGPLGEGGMSAEEYQALTRVAIKTDYDFDIPDPEPYVPEPRPERPQPQKGGRKTKRQPVERHERGPDGEIRVVDLREGESGSRTFKTLAQHDQVDTKGASDRLKRVIKIQREG